MLSQLEHILELHDEHDSGDQQCPLPSSAAEQTENDRRHCQVKQQHEVGEIRVWNHSDFDSAVRSILPLAVMGNASRNTNLRGNMYAGRR